MTPPNPRTPPPLTREQLVDLQHAAEFDRDHVGAPGSAARERALITLRLIAAYELLSVIAPFVCDRCESPVKSVVGIDGANHCVLCVFNLFTLEHNARAMAEEKLAAVQHG